LPLRPIRKGGKVRVLPERGSTKKGDQRLWQVKGIQRAKKSAVLELMGAEESETQTVAVDDLVVVAESRDTIYPGLVSTGKVLRGGDKPCHTVINGENYHVLKALTYTHRGKVDAIYIDPPYNSGAKDWKYNNDYVERDDSYRHSKWLAMMERRLIVAKELLNPEDSVLIVTIDEKEYLRLGLLLEQLFSEAGIQMVSTVINPKGAARASAFARTDEYLFVVTFGQASPTPLSLTTEWKTVRDKRAEGLRWAELLRSGTDPLRTDSPNQFNPVFIENTANGPSFHSVGDSYFGNNISEVIAPEGTVAVWPIRSNGVEGRWSNSAASLRNLISNGYARLGRWRAENTSITYLARGEQKKVESGEFPIVGRKSDNSIIVDASKYKPVFLPGTQWRLASHNAEQGGTNLLKLMIPGRKFPFPKSLYAVEDVLRFFIVSKPKAIVLDFFSGSGTTVHALMRLNKEDGGLRQCISVTNNEVGAGEQSELRVKGLRPGDSDWEKLGICDYITKPRVASAISGRTPENTPIEGFYLTGKTVEKETPRSFMQIGFVEPAMFDTAAKKKQFVALIDDLPQTLVKGSCPFIVSEDHAASVLFDPEAADEWLKALGGKEHITTFYIVTPVKRVFDLLKEKVTEMLGPVIVREEEKLPMSEGFEENAEFFTLTYETSLSVSHNLAFSRVAPLLWLRAGARGRRIDKLPADGWAVADAYALLNNVDAATPFIEALAQVDGVRIAYIVTDDDRRFQAIAKRLPDGVEPVRLYESYLTNFSFTNGE
jgi:adenine-specific DNA-methyltransferase